MAQVTEQAICQTVAPAFYTLKNGGYLDASAISFGE